MDYMGQSVSRASDNDKSSIVDLFITSDPRHNRSIAYYDSSNKSVYGSSVCVVAKNAADRVIGHYSILPLKFKYLNKIYYAGYAQQAIIHKKYRNLKLISELHEFAIDQVRKNIDFIFAFSNDSFADVKIKLFGWNDLGKFHSDVIDLRKVDFEINHKIESLNFFEHNFESNQNRVSIIKSKEYLNHRLLRHPINHYKTFIIKDVNNSIAGYISLKFYKNNDELIGHFVDFEASSDDVLKSLVSHAKEYFIFYGVYKVVFWNRAEYRKLFTPFIVDKGFVSNFIVKDISNNSEILNKELWNLPMILSDAF